MKILCLFPFFIFLIALPSQIASQSSSSSMDEKIIEITERFQALSPSIEKGLNGHLLEDEVTQLIKDLVAMRREAIEVLNNRSNNVHVDIENRLMVQEFKKLLDTISMIVSKMDSFLKLR